LRTEKHQNAWRLREARWPRLPVDSGYANVEALPATSLGELTTLLQAGERGSLPSPKTSPPLSALQASNSCNWGPLTYCWTRAPQSLAMPLVVKERKKWCFLWNTVFMVWYNHAALRCR